MVSPIILACQNLMKLERIPELEETTTPWRDFAPAPGEKELVKHIVCLSSFRLLSSSSDVQRSSSSKYIFTQDVT